MRGAKPPLRSNIDAGAPPRAPEVYAGLVAPATPDAGAPPCTRVTFPTQGKSPKVRQGLCPLESPGACSPPFSRSLRCAPTRAGLLSANTPDRFATLNLWANRSFFLPKLYRGSHFLLSIRGAAVRFDFCGLPGVSLFLGGAALAAAGGMIIAPKGSTQRGIPLWEILW